MFIDFDSPNQFENIAHEENTPETESPNLRRSTRKRTPSKRQEFIMNMYKSDLERKQKNKNKNKPIKSMPNDDDDDDETNETIFTMENQKVLARPPTLFDKDKDVAGERVYNFNTPKKRDGMVRLAANTPKTPLTDMKALSLNSPRTPKSSRKSIRFDAKTPHDTRKKQQKAVRKQTRKYNKDNDSEDEDDSDEEEESCTDDEDPDFNAIDQSDTEDDDDDDANSSSETSENEENRIPDLKKRGKSKPITKIINQKINIASAAPIRASERLRKQQKAQQEEFVPDSDNYFRTLNKKVIIQLQNFELPH